MNYVSILIPVLAGLVTAIWSVVQYFDDKYAKTYRQNVENLFSERKDVVLSAISTLAYFKGKVKFRLNVIDILLNRLYTELDIDIINAVISELSQVASAKEFEYVSQKLIDINRNFELQTPVIKSRQGDYKKIYDQYIEDLKGIATGTDEAFKKHHYDLLIESKNQLKKYEGLSQTTLKWHKQVSAEAFAMLMLESERKKITWNLEINLFENDFSYSHLFDFSLSIFNIRYSAFNHSPLQDLKIEKLNISNTIFESSKIRKCKFHSGMLSNMEFVNTQLDALVFENIVFEDVFFIGVEFNDCRFINVKGLNPLLFYNCRIVSEPDFINVNDFDKQLINTSTNEYLSDWLKRSKRSFYGRKLIAEKLKEQKTD